MFDEFSLFESTSFDDIMNDSYATESYDLFDDSYGYAFEQEAAEDNKDDGKKKAGLWEIIKGILAKFKEFVANFLQGIKNFLFGAKDDRGNVVKFGVAGYIGGLWKAAKADAETKLRQEAAEAKKNNSNSNESKFLAIEASDFSHAFEASDTEKLEAMGKKRDEFEKKSNEYQKNFDKYLTELKEKANEEGDKNVAKFMDQVIKSASRMTFTENDTDSTREYKRTWNDVNKVSRVALKTAEDTSKGAKKEEDISKFKAFIGTLSRFFKYLGGMIKLMVMSKTKIKKADKYYRAAGEYTEMENEINKSKNNGSTSKFLGNIAQEAYNAGYAHAMEFYGNMTDSYPSNSHDFLNDDITTW